VLSLFQNLFGLAVGPIVAGALSDLFDLETALAITPLFALLAAAAMLMAARSYETDMERVVAVQVAAEPEGQSTATTKPAV
jgi:hypothetical protein